jgi:hypothetical protein
MRPAANSSRIGVDVGGTFADVCSPEAVRADVLDGKLTPEQAEELCRWRR